jgi:hypothetical protein
MNGARAFAKINRQVAKKRQARQATRQDEGVNESS